MRKSMIFFLANLSLIMTLALFDYDAPVDNMADNSSQVGLDIEDGVVEEDTPAVNK